MNAESPQTRRIDSLKRHPRQGEIFADLPDAPLRALADDLDLNGLEHPVEITAAGVIIAGHQRCRAAALLGWTEIEVLVRDDLEAAGEAAIEERFLRDNVERRQLDEFAMFRALKALADLEWEKSRSSGDRRQFYERFFQQRDIPLSGKTLSRRFKVLELPSPIVAAVASKRLSQSAALKIVALSKETQATIAARIAADEDPRYVIEEIVIDPPSPDDPESPRAQYRMLVAWSETRLERMWQARRELAGVAGEHSSVARTLKQLIRFATQMRKAELRSRQDATAKVAAIFSELDS